MYWTPEIAVGVERIDDEHKALIERVNRLVAAIEAGREEEEIRSLFIFLRDYTQNHFAVEEELMRAHGYPEMDRHIADHQDLRANLDRFEQEIGAEEMTRELRGHFDDLIINWLFDHICQVDRAFGKFLGA
jgi:hemerythrin